MSDSKTQRQATIRQLVYQQGQVTVAELCEHLKVSEATIRRDLDELAAKRILHRTHGGAVRLDSNVSEPPIMQRMHEQAQAKHCIGQAAAGLIADGQTVFMGSGSTVLSVAQHLQDRRKLTVISNSLPVINLLADAPGITLIVPGGLLRQSEQSFIGHLTEQAISQLRADKVIMGIQALDVEQGLTSDYLPEIVTDRAILKISPQVILVADHTKLGRVAPSFVAPVAAVHTLVTDAGVPRETVVALEERGIRVVVAGDSGDSPAV